MNKNKIIFGSSVMVILVGIVGYFIWQFFNDPFRKLTSLEKTKPQLAPLIQEVRQALINLNKDKIDVKNYVILGFTWKSLADQTQEQKYYRKALEVYEEGITFSARKNTLLIMNAGSMAIYLNDFQLAKQYYEEAISIAPGDIAGYLKLIELHKYKLKSPSEQILAIYNQGLEKLVFNRGELLKERAGYEREIGNYELALKDYELLSKADPQNKRYKEIIAELKNLLNK